MKPGFHQMTMKEYLAGPAPSPEVSASVIRTTVQESAERAAAQHPQLGGHRGDHSDESDFGTLCHALMSEDDEIEVFDFPNWTGKGKLRKEYREKGITPVLLKDHSRAEKMVSIAKQFLHEALKKEGLITSYQTEQTYLWQRDGLWCKARADIVLDDYSLLVDYKTTTKVDVFSLRTKMYDTWCYSQPHYCDGIAAVTGVQPRFWWLAQEAAAPHSCHIVELGQEGREHARAEYEYGFRRWKAYDESGYILRAYPPIAREIEPPSYITYKAEERRFALMGDDQ